MARIPTTHYPRRADDDPPRRLGRAGLDALMRDPRYWDENAPEHGDVVDLVRRGFELVFPAAPGSDDGSTTATTLPESPFGRSVARRVRDIFRVEDWPVSKLEATGRDVLLDALRRSGQRLPSGFEEDRAGDDPARSASAEGGERTERGDANGDSGKLYPRFPLDRDGKEIRPHPDDPRFERDGALKEDFRPNDPWRLWYAENARYNPRTGEYEFYDQLREFQRDRDGRWRQFNEGDRAQPPRDSEQRRDGGLPTSEQNDPPDIHIPNPPLSGVPPHVPERRPRRRPAR